MADSPPFNDGTLAAITEFAEHFGIKEHDLDGNVWAIEIEGACRIALFLADEESLVCAVGGPWFDPEDLPSLQAVATANVPIFAQNGGTFGLDDEDHIVYLRRLPLSEVTGDQLIYLVSEMIGSLESWAEQWRDRQAAPPGDPTEATTATGSSDLPVRA